MPAKGKGRGKAVTGHQLASTLRKGTELKDLRKKSWYLGEAIGSGGFGLIYLADDDKNSTGNDKAKFVIKVEPHGNGPLYCEVAFYQRAARQETLTAWKNKTHLSYVGIPAYTSHGLHANGKENLRFMVMPRYGSDLHSLWLKANKKFPRATVCQLAIELINSLQYMHENEYVHADVKGANILLGFKNPNQIYLVDFGLAFRYIVDGKHKSYVEDPRKAHDGTIEYTSRDSHRGVAPSRRSDLEILGYVLLHWVCGRLPWEDNLNNKNYVRDQKIQNMDNIKAFISSVYPESKSKKAVEIEKFLLNVSKLEYDEEPDYTILKKYFQDALKSLGVPLKAKITFENDETPTPAKKKRTTQSRAKSSQSEEEGLCKKRPKRTPAKRKQVTSSSSEEDALNIESSATSETTPAKVTSKPKKLPTTSARKRRQKVTSKKAALTSSSDENIVNNDDSSTDAEEYSPEMSPPKKAKKIITKKQSKKTKTYIDENKLSTTATENSEEEVKVVDSTFDVTSPRRSPRFSSNIRNSITKSPSEIATGPKSSSMIKSRYSMAPLHTKSVLGKDDSLSGKFSGKHPVIIRRRKVKRPKNDATTQTTPSLKKTLARA